MPLMTYCGRKQVIRVKVNQVFEQLANDNKVARRAGRSYLMATRPL